MSYEIINVSVDKENELGGFEIAGYLSDDEYEKLESFLSDHGVIVSPISESLTAVGFSMLNNSPMSVSDLVSEFFEVL